MKHNYRAYVISRDGYVIGRVRIACNDDASAKSRVEKLVALHALELWDGERKVAAFEPRPSFPGNASARNQSARLGLNPRSLWNWFDVNDGPSFFPAAGAVSHSEAGEPLASDGKIPQGGTLGTTTAWRRNL